MFAFIDTTLSLILLVLTISMLSKMKLLRSSFFAHPFFVNSVLYNLQLCSYESHTFFMNLQFD
jgi:hypothetical protein